MVDLEVRAFDSRFDTPRPGDREDKGEVNHCTTYYGPVGKCQIL
ncbi:MAG: hypothetical protein NTZ65_00530 [Candidatus Berkelbacteria bacterium]|nr:hypothetical protein [Candidatus Berkelbacteria bacterium]